MTARYESLCAVCNACVDDDVPCCPSHPESATYMVQVEPQEGVASEQSPPHAGPALRAGGAPPSCGSSELGAQCKHGPGHGNPCIECEQGEGIDEIKARHARAENLHRASREHGDRRILLRMVNELQSESDRAVLALELMGAAKERKEKELRAKLAEAEKTLFDMCEQAGAGHRYAIAWINKADAAESKLAAVTAQRDAAEDKIGGLILELGATHVKLEDAEAKLRERVEE